MAAKKKVEITLEEFEYLQREMTDVNQQIAKVEGQVEQRRDSLKQILDKHGTKTLSEFKKKVEAEEGKAVIILDEALAYVESSSQQLKELDSLLIMGEDNGSGDNGNGTD